jgi:ankyrin repeat protein
VTKLFKSAVTMLLAAAISAGVYGAELDTSWFVPSDVLNDPQGLLPEQDRKNLEDAARSCLTEFSVPLCVVVLPSLAEFGGQGVPIETYADALLEDLRQAYAVEATADGDYGLVLLLIDDERQLNLAVGAAWDRSFFAGSRRAVKRERERISAEHPPRQALLLATKHLAGQVRATRETGGQDRSSLYLLAGAGLALVLAVVVFVVLRRARAKKLAGLHEAALDRSSTLIQKKLDHGADPDAFDEQGYTAAIYAAGHGDLRALQSLCDHGADLGLATDQGETPVYSAAQNGHAEVAAFLLSKGVPVDPLTVHNETPLLIAAREGHVEIVAGLLHAGADVNQQDNRGWGSLMIALREGHDDVVTLLINHNVDVNLGPKDGPNALMMVVKQEDENLVRRLVERGADVHHQARDGMCALRIAVLRGNQPIARRLLNAGANVSAPFANKEKPVEMAERQGHAELATYLRKREKKLAACMDILEVVARGDLARIREIVVQVPASVNVHSKRSRWTPLLIAVRAEQLEIAQTLLEHGADVHARSSEGKPAIAYAVDADNLGLVKALLEGGARIDQIDAKGTDLKSYAEAQGHGEIVSFADSFVAQQAAGYALFTAVEEDDPPHALTILKESPGCVDARTRHERWTPLLQAARAVNLGMARLLVEYGAQVNLCNSRGMSPLMYAARSGDLNTVRLLLEHGADVRLRSREGNTACEFALDKGHARVVMLLQEIEGQLSDLSEAGFPGESKTDAADGDAGRALDIFQAVQEGDIKRLKQVLHYWPECVRLRWGPSELTPLHMAISAGNLALAELLVDANADVNAPTREGRMPLHQAVGRADAGLVALLVSHEADLKVKSQGQSPVQAAEAAGYDDIVEVIAKTRSDLKE